MGFIVAHMDTSLPIGTPSLVVFGPTSKLLNIWPTNQFIFTNPLIVFYLKFKNLVLLVLEQPML